MGAIRKATSKVSTSAIRPTLPARPKATTAKRPALPKLPKPNGGPPAKAPAGKLGRGVEGLTKALEIHKQIADIGINSQNLVSPGAVAAAHVVEQHTGLNNVASAAYGGGLRRKKR